MDHEGRRIATLPPMRAKVLRLIGEGRSYREIAAQIGRSHNTVRSHVRVLMQQLHIHNRAGLIQYALHYEKEK